MDSLFADPGSSAAQFLKIGSGARSAAMGGSVSANSPDPEAIYWNPAFLTQIGPAQMTASHSNAPGFYQFHHGAFSWKTNRTGYGISATMVEYAQLIKTDNTGQITGDFSAFDQNISIAIARKIKTGLSSGLTIKNITQTISRVSGSALAVDGGVLFQQTSWNLALGASNWGNRLKLDQESFPLPSNIKIAASYFYSSNTGEEEIPRSSINSELWHWRDSGLTWRTGVEHWFETDTPTEDTLWMAFRAGYKSEQAKSQEAFAALSAGIGIWYKSLGLDFSFEPMAEIGEIYQLGVKWQW